VGALSTGAGGLVGPLGFAVGPAVLQWKGWSVAVAEGDHGMKHHQAPYAGDDSRYTDLIEQDILDRDLGVRARACVGVGVHRSYES
jgi:hypothetical protein